MAKRIVEEFGDTKDIITVFANTGQEHEETLKFVDKCDKAFGLNVVWVESKVHHGRRKGCTSKVVDFESACRDGRLFEEMIKKYGIPNMAYPHCTRELKTNPLHHYCRSIKWEKGEYLTAIGIRSDEIDRVNPRFEEEKYWYPLIDWQITKQDVNEFWEKQAFNLEIPEHLGNCIWCWKKTLKKQMAVISDMPNAHKVPMYLEDNYTEAGAGEGDRVFFREKMTARDLYKLYKDGAVERFVDLKFNDCKESCEAFR